VSINAEILADGPVAYWPLDGSLDDESGNGHHLVRTAGEFIWEYGMLCGGAFASTADLGSGDWTVRADVNTGYYSGRGGWVVGDGDGGGGLLVPTGAGLAWLRTTGLGQPWRGLFTSGGDEGGGAAEWEPGAYYSPIENRVVTAVAICSGGTVELYVDGTMVGSGAGDAATGGPVVLEEWDSGTGARRGQIAVFDWALSPFRVNVHTYGAPVLGDTAQAVADAMEADVAVGVWTVPTGDGDAIVDQTGTSGDATLDSGAGFITPVADEGFGFSLAGSDWDLGATPDATTFTIEFAFRATGAGVSPVELGDGGDISVTAIGSLGTSSYSATIGADTVTWSTTQDDRVHLVAVTWDDTGNELVLVVDGVARDTVNPTSGSITPADITVSSPDPTQQVGTIAVYDVALTPAQLLDHYLLLTPPLLPACVVDDFDRANGALGNSSLQSLPWADVAGTSAITSNAATASRVSYLEDTHGPAPAGLILGVEANVDDGGVGGVVAVGLWDGSEFIGAYVDFGAGTVNISTTSGDGSWYGAGLDVTVDLSAGAALVRFQLGDVVEQDPDAPPAPPARDVTVWVDGVPAIVTTGDADLGGVPALGTQAGGRVLDLALLEPDGLGQAALGDQVGGLLFRFDAFDGVELGSSTQGPQAGGLMAPDDIDRHGGPVYLGSSPGVAQVGGIRTIWTNGTPATPPVGEPFVWAGVGAPPADLTVAGFPKRTAASCWPTMNGAGSGSFTVVPPGPALGDVVVYHSGGGPVFSGYADRITTVERDQNEEAGQLVTVVTPCLLSIDWSETVVWPDFGAFEPIRLGAPPQDDREFGWPMNGILTAEQEADLVPSVANDDSLYGTPGEVLPIPDNWPDSTARWMWDTSPDTPSQPQGWCYFRVAFGSWPGKYACFLNAWDYAKMWIDGALIAEVTTPGQTVRFDVEFDWDYHLLAIAAWNEQGPAGVMCSVMQHHADGSGLAQPAMNSRGGWKVLAYPEKSLRAPVGKVIRRLVREAAARGAPAGDWTCAFTDEADSAGRAWDQDVLLVQRTGQTMWDVLNQAAESLVDFHPSPAGKTLHLYKKDQGGGAVSQPWAPTVHAESLATEVGGR
jgi:hypothetical protein